MTTKQGSTEAAPTKAIELIHLTSEYGNLGEVETWCGAVSVSAVSASEALAKTTCILCLKAAKIYGEGAAERLLQLEAAQ